MKKSEIQINYDGKVMLMSEYCEHYCLDRFDSECWTACQVNALSDDFDECGDDEIDYNDWDEDCGNF